MPAFSPGVLAGLEIRQQDCWRGELKLALRSRLADGRRRIDPDRIARDDQLDAPVLLPAGGRIVGRDRLRFPEADRGHHIRRDTLRGEIVTDRAGALFGELLVVLVASDAVG